MFTNRFLRLALIIAMMIIFFQKPLIKVHSLNKPYFLKSIESEEKKIVKYVSKENLNKKKLLSIEFKKLYDQGRYQEIIDALENKTSLNSSERYLLAVIYQHIGKIALAIEYWDQATQSYLEEYHFDLASYCLLQLAQAYIKVGRNNDAISAIQNWSYRLPNFGSAVLGNAYLANGQLEEAIASYEQAQNLEMSDAQKIALLNNLGSGYEKLAVNLERSAQNVRSIEEKNIFEKRSLQALDNATKVRKRAWKKAQTLSFPSAVTAKLNWFKYDQNVKILEAVAEDIEKLPINHRTIELIISLADVSSEPKIYLDRAIQFAEDIGDNLNLAIASAKLGELYEKEEEYDLALSYIEQAQEYIYPLLKYDHLYQYQYQEARIYSKLNQVEKSKLAYERSLITLEQIRPQLAFSAKDIEFDFNESIEPIYRGFLDLLLAGNPSTNDLKKSLKVFEQLQIIQLENIFADICFEGELKDTTERLKEENIAVITSIILDNAVHIIALTPDGKYIHHAHPINATELNKQIAQWRFDLQDISEQRYLLTSSFFYDILFKPFEELMEKSKPDTIIFVNDGLFRNIPMSTLYDGENREFLIEKYPLSVALGQNFLSSKSIGFPNRPVAFGLSEAVPPVNVALPNVPVEINFLQQTIGADIGIDQDFTRDSLLQKIVGNYISVLHLATHGEFTGLIEKSFIQTYDQILTTFEFEKILIEANTINLLTLSACETASGDNRAVLGLAGVAIRTGIPSVISSLWAVPDLLTPKLMKNFYDFWKIEKSKPKALQRVQIEQIKQNAHPSTWSSFILIGI